MRNFSFGAAVSFFLALSPGLIFAQTTDAVSPRDAVEPGANYVQGEFKDWTLRCIRIDEITDPCEIHQTLSDANGNKTAEFNLFPLDQAPRVAGGTIVTPLETLLTRNVSLTVTGDARGAQAYPYSFCNRVGCVAQIGFLQNDIDSFKLGSTAKVVIYPVAAPDQAVELTVSLSGFTAAFEALKAIPQP